MVKYNTKVLGFGDNVVDLYEHSHMPVSRRELCKSVCIFQNVWCRESCIYGIFWK